MQKDILFYAFAAVFGLVIGSFLNVLIYRLPRKKKIVFDRSACPQCGEAIAFYHNIPLLSYLILRGKCARCKGKISPKYPLVEALNAILYMFLLYVDGPGWLLPAHCYLASSLLAIFFIDLEFQIIPDKITLPGIVVGLGSAIFLSPPGIVNSLLGLLIGGGGLLGIAYLGEWLFKKEAMGGGDIKMAAMMGAFVGWQKVLLIFLSGATIGMVVSLIWMAASAKVRSERIIPFGPFLAIGAMLVVVYGDSILHYYIETFLRI